MTTTSVRSLLLLAAAAVLLAACSTAEGMPPVAEPRPPAQQPDEAPTQGDPQPQEPLATAPIVASWDPTAASVDLDGVRTIGDCEGDLPALCVEEAGLVIGLLEEFRYPAPGDLLERSGDDLERALRDFAADRVTDVAEDRRVTCGTDHEVLPDAPDGVSVDGATGLRYGFVTMSDDEVVEHVVTWATVRDSELRLLVVHAASPDGCMASELTTFGIDELTALLPALDRVVAGTPLPV